MYSHPVFYVCHSPKVRSHLGFSTQMAVRLFYELWNYTVPGYSQALFLVAGSAALMTGQVRQREIRHGAKVGGTGHVRGSPRATRGGGLCSGVLTQAHFPPRSFGHGPCLSQHGLWNALP